MNQIEINRRLFRLELARLRTAIIWRRRHEDPPPRPFYCADAMFQVFPIRVPGLRAMREPNMQQIPRSRA